MRQVRGSGLQELLKVVARLEHDDVIIIRNSWHTQWGWQGEIREESALDTSEEEK